MGTSEGTGGTVKPQSIQIVCGPNSLIVTRTDVFEDYLSLFEYLNKQFGTSIPYERGPVAETSKGTP